MKRLLIFILTVGCITGICAQSAINTAPGTRAQSVVNTSLRTFSFDDDWRFFKGDDTAASSPSYDDAGWRQLDLPHDWSIEDLPGQSDSVIGPFSKHSIGATSTGYTEGGTAWYRKKFILTEKDNGKKVSLLFDGVYMNSDVWINGHHLGNHPYGYTPFNYDLTAYLNPAGKPNTLAVSVRNEGQSSRWYTGSGIYRHVWMTVSEPLHVDQWGVYITTPEVSTQKATVNITTTINSPATGRAAVMLRSRIIDSNGKIAGKKETTRVLAEGKNDVSQTIILTNPQLWSPETPALYKVETVIIENGQEADHTLTNFGVRSIRFDAKKGFTLNGKKLLLRGGSAHHDNGSLGSVTIDRAEERKVALLKSAGFNAVRTSHNPPSTPFLDACDRLGLFVIDEAFDMWAVGKKPQDYHLYFREWWKKDIQNLLMRDRNHPSIILWSIGNEIKEVSDPPGLVIARQLRETVRSLDTTRPVTEAICDFWDRKDLTWESTAASFSFLDVGGYNYEWKRYVEDHKKFPDRIIVGTESFPKEAFENWNAVKKYPWVCGDFVWTAMDYIGETAIGHSVLDNEKDGPALEWPWYNAWCGDIDLIGGKKPQSYYRDVLWGRSKIEMNVHVPIPEGRTEIVSKWGWPNEVQSWTWPGQEGKKMQVSVYSTYPLVRLKLNGRTIADQQLHDSSGLTANFEVPYEAGILTATGIENGKEAASAVLKTVSAPAKIRLKADRKTIRKDRNDLCYIIVEITDDMGNPHPDAAVPVSFTIAGDGELAAVGNANPTDMRSFKQPVCTTFRGRCLVILRPKGTKGVITLKASSARLEAAEIDVAVD